MVHPDAVASIPSKKKVWPLALGVGVVLFLVGAVGAWALSSSDDDETAFEGEVFVQEAGEIFLEPADEVGPEPFASTAFASAPLPEHTAQDAPAEESTTEITTSDGRTPGLYGGSTDNTVCDPAAMIEFLVANPDKAAAWVAALNTDPDVTSLNGGLLTVDDLPTYIGGLTPVVLSHDTRVTNNGFRDGKPTPRQAVLEKGSAVLVDANGIPRARCYCGNPLTAPVPSPVSPTYTGGSPDWNIPTDLQVISPPATPSNDPLQVTPPGNPNGPLSPLSPPVYTTCPFSDAALCTEFMRVFGEATTTTTSTTSSSTTSTSTTTSTTTTTTTSTAPSGGASDPVLSDVAVRANPSDDGNCSGQVPEWRGYIVTGSYSDPDGDAGVVLTADYGDGYEDASSYTTFTGDGGSGSFEMTICTVPGNTVALILGDMLGNGSNEIRIAMP
ncbi:MAG: DUF6777-containing protein [Acidimicrobiales bacterium]